MDQEGTGHTVRAEPGPTLMEIATFNNVPGILAECGGGASCGTCHVYVDEAWLSVLPEPGPEETDLVEFLEDVRPNSRLACQIVLDDALDGLVVTPVAHA